MADEGIVDIAPEYQRQFRWPRENQSRLIESVLLGIPVPSLFMAANKDGSWELIDGVQRLSSLIHFVGNEEQLEKLGFKSNLTLNSLDVLTEFNGSSYKDLPQTLKLKFSLRPLKVTTLSDKSDLKVRFDLFERLNTGGIKLTDQEIRACVFRGQFNDFISELSENEHFNAVVNLPKAKESDGTKAELILKFFSYKNNRDNFEHSVVDFLNDYMADSSVSFNYKKNRSIFENTFEALASELPEGIKRGNRKTTPFNLFEAISIGAADAIEEGTDIRGKDVETWIDDEELTKLTSSATNSKPKLKARIGYCYDRFK
ncbi:GmrSD restriction endonuclease domain-containing protein [Vreelandella zhuhanensis]|uniref:GmrSD restriction endonuclease domain-containing protein n=1 Tax=Vreelandella zhuhanensis TaxID=2684210 RepID=UPI0019229F56|nr:DUF262 domain-containing protein [Halomonas zhuhanensis]